MKKLIIILLISVSCNSEPVLNTTEYTIVDTLNTARNGAGWVLGYDVILQVNYDSTYHYGYISSKSKLILFNPRPIKLDTNGTN